MSPEEEKSGLTKLLDAQGRGSRSRIAKLFGVSRQTVWRWENNKDPIPSSALPVFVDMATAAGLDYTVHDLVLLDPLVAQRYKLETVRA